MKYHYRNIQGDIDLLEIQHWIKQSGFHYVYYIDYILGSTLKLWNTPQYSFLCRSTIDLWEWDFCDDMTWLVIGGY